MILLLILVNGLLSGAEIAVVSVRAGRLKELLAAGGSSAKALARLRDDPERFLATVQVGITVVGASAAAFGGATFAEELVPWVARIPFATEYAEEISLALVITLISYLSVVVGELVPKSLALRVSERYALLAARPLLWLSSIAAPAVWLLTVSSNVLLRPFKDSTNFTEARISLEEVRHMVGEASRAGSIDAGAGEIASRALDLASLTAGDVMIHRRFVVALPRDASASDLRRVLLEAGHRRIPIFDRSIDNVVGYVSWRDVVERVWDGLEPSIDQILRPVHFVPESSSAAELLEQMREKRLHLAIVLDEHGGLSGILTLEDLLEELVGEIGSEHDTVRSTDVQRESDGSWLVVGTAPLREIERALALDLGPPADEFVTVGGWCVALAGDRIPTSGERFNAPNVVLEIVDASPRRVRKVRVRRA